MSQSDQTSGFWRRLRVLVGGAPPPAPPPAPLFRLRPVPPPEPKGPGLPDWDEILAEPPPVTENMTDPERIATWLAATTPPARLVEPEEPAPPAPAPEPEPPPPEVERVVSLATPSGYNLTAQENDALDQIRGMIVAGRFEQAQALLNGVFAGRPEARDRNGLPVYLVESLRCALALNEAARAEGLARQLRPQLETSDPLLESLFARAAMQRRDRATARAAWQAALARAPDLLEARDWLKRNPVSPDGGIAAFDLVAGQKPAVLSGGVLPTPSGADSGTPPHGAPATLLGAATLSVDADGAVVIGGGDAPARAVPSDNSDLAIVLRHPEGLEAPHGFITAVFALHAVLRTGFAHLRPARIYVGRQPWALAPGTALQPELLAVLFPGIRVVGDFDGTVREERVLLLDGAKRDEATDTLLGGFLPAVVRESVAARQRIFAAFGLPGTAEPPRTPGRPPVALVLQTPPPRALTEPAVTQLIEMLRRIGYGVIVADTARLTWRQQVRLGCAVDLIIGAHSPEMTMVLWGHPQTRVLEFFPEGTCRYDGQLLAEAAGLGYLGLEGVAERGFVIRARERWGKPVGQADRLVHALPWAMLEQTLTPQAPPPPAPPSPAAPPPAVS